MSIDTHQPKILIDDNGVNNYFGGSLDHIMAEVTRIEMLLQVRVACQNHENEQSPRDTFKGLYISDQEVTAILGTPISPVKGETPFSAAPQTTRVAVAIRQREREIEAKKLASLHRGITLRLDNLGKVFRLTSFDIDTLLICLLPEIDLKYRQLYAYLQNDVTQKNPTVNLILEILGKSLPNQLQARQAFAADAPLVKYQLVHFVDNPAAAMMPLLAKSLQVDARILQYLLEMDQIDSLLLPFVQLLEPKRKLEEIILPEETRQLLTTLILQPGSSPVCHLHGDNGVGKKSTAEAICAELGIPVLYVELSRLLLNKSKLESLMPLILREGVLQNAALYLDGYDGLLTDEIETKSSADYLLLALKKYPQWVFVASNKEWRPKESWQDRPFVSIELPLPSYALRRQLWEKYWDKNVVRDKDVDLNDFASKFRLTGGQIHNVVINARNAARRQPAGQQIVSVHDLSSLCRDESRAVLHDMARKIQPKHSWQDIILPSDLLSQLREIANYIRYYHRVYSDWGFEKKLSLGKGLNVLFSGPSGTGKTMAAEIIAHELQLDLYKIDLSTIVSKYIGETEKNLNSIFKEGQASNAIIFFDEADAIFGKRSEVKDAHDRYANIEIAYLLQKMDEYEGMVVLATNLRKNIDDAFSRRMHFALDFPVPDELDRKRIWQSIFPAEAPRESDIDFAFLARQFQITGGNIKNIALGAAFFAAQNSHFINMRDIIRATKREYQKMGKLCTVDDFAEYLEVVR